MIIPGLKDWFEGTFGASLQHKTPATVSSSHSFLFCRVFSRLASSLAGCFVVSQPILSSDAVPPPTLNEAFVEEMKSTSIPMSHQVEDRVFRGHGELPLSKTTNHVGAVLSFIHVTRDLLK